MSETLSEFIARRCVEIDQAADELRHKLSVVLDERRQLQNAAEVNGLALPPAPVLHLHVKDGATISVRMEGMRISERTIKTSVMDILREATQPMKAMDILKAINAKFGTDYPRTSLSPQLSRLKTEGEIVRDGSLWSLAPPPRQDHMFDPQPETEEPRYLTDMRSALSSSRSKHEGSPVGPGEPSTELGDA